MSFLKDFRKNVAQRIWKPPVEKQSLVQPIFFSVPDIEEAERKAVLPTWFFSSKRGMPHGLDVYELRELAKTPTPRMCVQRLVNDVMTTQWEIVAKKGAEAKAMQIGNWLNMPNENGEPFSHVLCQMVTDVLELDAGVWVKEFGRTNKQLVQLWARDGGRFLKDVDEFGKLGKHYDSVRYEVWNPRQKKKDWREEKDVDIAYWQHSYQTTTAVPYCKEEVVYFMQHPRTDTGVYGTSKINVLRLLIKSLAMGEEYFMEYWRQGATGSVLISTEEKFADDTNYNAFRDKITSALTSRLIKIVAADHGAKATQLGISPEQMQWLETKDEYRHLVMAIFNTMPEIHGFTKDIHKATAESQRDIYVQRGLAPLLDLIQFKINAEVISEFFPKGKEIECAFRFKLYDPIGERRRLEIDEIALKNNLRTINELRVRDNLPKLAYGDILPSFLSNPQQWAQGKQVGGWSEDQLIEITNIPEPKEPLVVPTAKPELEEGEPWKAYKRSRMEQPFRKTLADEAIPTEIEIRRMVEEWREKQKQKEKEN